MNWRDLLLESRAPRMVSLTELPTDPEAARRHEARVKEARERMGARWLLHPANQVKRREAA
jgi:hypothetical protein